MEAKIYGTCHIVYVCILTVLIVLSSVLGSKFLNEKGKLIFSKIMGALTLITCVLSRIFHAKMFGGWVKMLPNSYCSMSGICFGVTLLVAKPSNNAFHCFWYAAFIGGLVTMFYPDFFADTPDNFFHPKTFTCLTYHALMFWECILMVVFKQFKFDIKKVFILPLGLLGYIAFGFFGIYVLKFDFSMCINKPILNGTPIYYWFILTVGTALAYLLNLIILLIKRKNKTVEA